MLIIRCNITRHGIFENKNIEFDKEITVVVGRNNSGKTLLSKSLIDVIFFLGNGGFLLDGKAWDNMYVEVHCIWGGKQYKIVRNNGKLFSISSLGDKEKSILSLDLKTATIEYESFYSSLAQNIPEGQILTTFFSRFDKRSYASLCYIPSAFDNGTSSVVSFTTLKKIFVEDDREFCDIYNHLKKIVNEKHQSCSEYCVSESEIEKLNKELKEVEHRIAIIDLEYSKYEKLIRERLKIENSALQKKREIELLTERRKIGERILENQHRVADVDISLNSRMQELAEERRVRMEIERLVKKSTELFPQFIGFSESQKANLKKVQDYYRELRDANEALNEYLSSMVKKNNIIKGAVISLCIASLMAVVLVVSGILTVVTPVKKILFIGSLLGFSIIAVTMLLVYNLIIARSKKLSHLRLRVEDLAGRIEVLLRENNVKFSGLGMEPLYEFLLQYFEEYSEYTELQMDILQLKNSLKSEKEIEDLEKEINLLTKRKKELIEEIEKDRALLNDSFLIDNSAAATLEYIFSLEKKIEALEQEITYDSGLLSRLDEEINAMSFREDERPKYIEKKKELIQKLEEYESRREAMKYLLKVFEDTEEHRWTNIKALIVQRSEEIFHELTDKAYITALDREVFYNLLDGTVKEDLHRSIVHVLMLSVKIALTDFLIDFNYPLPLILDDPFLFMDEVRMWHLKDILDRVAKKRQIIVFTHILPFDGWGKVVEL
ncbi:MAG: hypothetical protein N2316_07615 [Spirochaetes bacterium]|nr:hypothetical protein [Spirochaetota bacterium]